MSLPLVLLPGMMCDARLFAPQVADLTRDYDVTVLGIGGQDNIAALAAAVLADAPPRFALGGLSMGGIVAMEVLRQAPGRVAGLALMDTNPLAEAESVKQWRIPQMEKVRAGQLDRVMREEMKPRYLTDGPQRAAILDLCMEMALALGEDVFVNQSIALQTRPDQTETLRAARLPALVLCGRDDSLCPVARHELIHELVTGSTLEIIEGAGHLPTLEQPKQTTAALRRWMEEV